MPEWSSPPPKSSHEEWIPLLLGLVFFTGGTWFWVENAVVMHEVPSFIFAFAVSFLSAAVMRQSASSKTDYLSLVTPILAVLSTMAAIYFIRMKGIREAYRMRGRPEPDWWISSEVLRDLLTKGGTGMGQMELVVLLAASLSGVVCASAFVPRGRD